MVMGDIKLWDGFSSSIEDCLVSDAKQVNFCMLYHGNSRDGEGFVISTSDGDMKGCKHVAVRDRPESVSDTGRQAGEQMRSVWVMA
eukprot:2629103-Ditylum_brightwellii.AAC.1